MRTNYLVHLRRTFTVPQGSFVYMSAKDIMSGKPQFVPDITIPTGRGARHKARRLALANPGTHVNVTDKRGACHYHARATATGTIYAECYHWGCRSPVRRVTLQTHPSAEDIASRQARAEIVASYRVPC